MLSLYLFGIGKYLDLLEEYSLPDTLNWKQGLRNYADFLLQWVKLEYDGGRKAAFPYDYYFDGNNTDASGNPYTGACPVYDPNDPECRETYPAYTWSLVAADVFAYAYKYSGVVSYLSEAGKFFLAGTEDHYYLGCVPTYYYSKEATNIINNGPFYIYHAGSVALPVYRFWSYVYSSHHYTISEWERNYIIATWPDYWIYEGIGWYAFPGGS